MVCVLLHLAQSWGLDLPQLEGALLPPPPAQARDRLESSPLCLTHRMMRQHQRPCYWRWPPPASLGDLNSPNLALPAPTWHLGQDRQLKPPGGYERPSHRAHGQACASGLSAELRLLVQLLPVVAGLMLFPSP